MQPPYEKIYELEPTITNWEGIRLTVRLEFPDTHSFTSQQIIDRRMLDTVQYLKMPEDIKIHIENRDSAQSHMLVIKWDQKNKQAKKLLERIAHDISWHLLTGLEKYYANL